MAELPEFLRGTRARRSHLERLLDRSEQLEHELRDVLAAILEIVPDDDDLAAECRRLRDDLDR